MCNVYSARSVFTSAATRRRCQLLAAKLFIIQRRVSEHLVQLADEGHVRVMLNLLPGYH